MLKTTNNVFVYSFFTAFITLLSTNVVFAELTVAETVNEAVECINKKCAHYVNGKITFVDHAHIKARARGSRAKDSDSKGKFDYQEKYYEIPKGWEIDKSVGNYSTPRFIAPNGFSPICGPACVDKIGTNGGDPNDPSEGHSDPKCGWIKIIRDKKNPRKYLISAYAGCVYSWLGLGIINGGGNWAESDIGIHLVKKPDFYTTH
ncbi:hypothetical protein QUF74_09525 [Candidatus Halobeggiatoa sp. HSG11]|nr:hypothetical protein [Candidatus Halobeggiatoa sp. HSG11]